MPLGALSVSQYFSLLPTPLSSASPCSAGTCQTAQEQHELGEAQLEGDAIIGLEVLESAHRQKLKDTGAYEIIEIVHLGFRVVLDGKKG